MIIENAVGSGVIGRGKRKARNKFYKINSPLITSGHMAGRRDSPRITARLQIIPDTAFDQFNDRKLTGFTLAELQTVADGGEPVILTDNDDRVMAKLSLGPALDQWTKAELCEILDTVRESGGVFLTASRQDTSDLQREKLSQGQQPIVVNLSPEAVAPKTRRPKSVVKPARPNGPPEARVADSESSRPAETPEKPDVRLATSAPEGPEDDEDLL